MKSIYLTCALATALTATASSCKEVCCPTIANPIGFEYRYDDFRCSGMVYELYGQALFLQPNGSNLYYAVEATPLDPDIAVPAVSPNWQVFEISPDYHPGFQVGVNFLFPDRGVNLEANWERLHGEDRESFTAPLVSDMVGPIFDIGPNSAFYQSAKGHGSFHFDLANLIVGKKYCFVNDLYLHPYTGAAFTRIYQRIYGKYTNLSGTIQRVIAAPSTFLGAGPQFGVDFQYRVYDSLFFTGTTSIAMLMGQLKNHQTYKSWTPELATLGIPQPNRQKTSVPSRSQLVPGFEEKLGFEYAARFNCWKMTVGCGYQFQIYLNAVQSFDMISQVLPELFVDTPDVGLFAVGYQRTLSNFILSGPYFDLVFDF